MICTKWSKDALNGQYFQKFTQVQERNFREYLKNSLIFHSHSFRFHSRRFLFVLLFSFFLADLPKPHQNWMKLVIRGPNLIECDKIGVKIT